MGWIRVLKPEHASRCCHSRTGRHCKLRQRPRRIRATTRSTALLIAKPAPAPASPTRTSSSPSGGSAARPREDSLLCYGVDVVEHVEDHHGIRRAVVYVTDVAMHARKPRTRVERKRAPRARDFPRVDVDAQIGFKLRRC